MKIQHIISCSIFFIFVFCNQSSYSQTIEEASAFFMRKELDSAFAAAKHILDHDKTIPDAYVIAGRVLVGKSQYEEAINYLETAKTLPNAPGYSRAWAMRDLGLCYYSKGDYVKAKENLEACIALNATKNATATAKNSLLKLGFDKLYDNWIKVESPHFIFHMQDTNSVKNLTVFIQTKEIAFDSINNFFKSTLPKKIDYFVWSNPQEADSIFKHELAFSESSLCLTHTDPKHTIGHEMTHSISYHAGSIAVQTKLIAEGVCVYFDLSERKNIKVIKSRIKSPINILELWNSNSKSNDEIIYPLGSELVKRLIETYGREKFMTLLSDQSYTNAKNIYGEGLDKIIFTLEEEINK